MIDQISRRSWIASIAAISLVRAQPNWQPVFLTTVENEALIVLGERIIPGSTAAQTNRVIDLLLNIEAPATQTGFREALKSFSDAGFQQLSSTEQDALLTRSATPNDPREHAFHYVKEWLADAYWTSKPGLHELGFDGQMAWPEFNPCPHPAA